jgi:hypothetical protein
VLGCYDLVFAKARCALEAMATGAAVVLCDARGLGPMVTTGDFEWLRTFNFGQGVLTRPLSSAAVLSELRRYDPVNAGQVCDRVRSEACLEVSAKSWIRLYEEILTEARAGLPDDAAGPLAAARMDMRYRWEARVERQEAWWRLLERFPPAGSFAARIGRRLTLLWPVS